MGSKQAPEPQPVTNIPQAQSYGSVLSDYIANLPKMMEMEKQYGPEMAQVSLDLLQQFGPAYNDYMAQEQKRLEPYTYGLQEQLAKLASEGAGGGIPSALQNTYLDQLRAEVGPNAGSGIGGDYVSSGLSRLAEDYKSHYQNLGLQVMGYQSNPVTPNFQSAGSGIGNAMSYASQNYGNYVGGLTSVPYYTPYRSGGMSGSGLLGGAGMGMLAGAALAPFTGGLSLPMAMGIGGVAGGAMGGFGGGR